MQKDEKKAHHKRVGLFFIRSFLSEDQGLSSMDQIVARRFSVDREKGCLR